MDPPRRDRAAAVPAVADEKARRRGSGGGSKKSSRRKPPSSSSLAPGPGGERARGHGTDARIDSSSGGGAAPRADLATHTNGPDGDAAQRKDHLRPGEPAPATRTRSGAKSVRRGSGRPDVDGGGDRIGSERLQRERTQREQVTAAAAVDKGGLLGGGGGAGSSVDRAILQKWRSDASAKVAVGGGRPAEQQELPPEVEAEDNGGGYDDEGFEDYSDEFEGEEEGPPQRASAAAAAPTARPGSSRAAGGAGAAGAIVSPSLKMRKAGDVHNPDDKALEELRDSLRDENIVARERKDARPSTDAEEKPASGSRQTTRGAKGAKGSRNAAATSGGIDGGSPTPAVAKGTFSVSADAKTSRRSSGFKMADAKALTRALAKGDPRAARVVAIRAASRLEVESARLFDQPPILPIDLYHRRLRGQPALIRQAGSQTNEDARSVEAQTDEVLCADKEAQFHLGHDDTALENLMRRLRSNRRPAMPLDHPAGTGGEEEKNGRDWTVVEGDEHVSGAWAAQGAMTTFKGLYNANGNNNRGTGERSQPAEHLQRHGADIGGGSGGGSQRDPPAPLRLGKFLRQASVVMETLCEENLLHAAVRAGASPVSSASGRGRGGGDRNGRLLFSKFPEKGDEKGWEEVTYGHGQGAPELAAAANCSRPGQEEKSREHDAAATAPASGSVSGGLNELLKGSEVVGVEFSRVKRSMLVTAHARPVGRRRRRVGNGDGADEGKDNSDGSGGDGGGDGDNEAMGERGLALEGSGVICVWNTDDVKAGPVSMLCGEGVFSCLCLPLYQAHVVITGTAEGCLLLWDLRGPASMHLAAESRDLGLPCGIGPPTYTTAGGAGAGGGGEGAVLDTGCGHTSTIVSIVPIPVGEGRGVDSGGGGGGGLGGVLSLEEANFFQVASLDDRGTVAIWLASEVPRGDEGGSQTDLGLGPGGRIRLTLSKSIRPGVRSPPVNGIVDGGGGSSCRRGGPASTIYSSTAMGELDSAAPYAAASARAMAFPPGDPNRFLVGGSSGWVTHGSRLGNPPPPRVYRPPRRLDEPLFAAPSGEGGGEGKGREDSGAAMGGVTCLAFSPFFQEYFLAGCGDGSVRLYKDDSSVPLTVWEGGLAAAGGSSSSTGSGWPDAVTSVTWSEHRPAVFFVLDAAGTLHAFDVLEDDTGPVSSASCPTTATAAAVAPKGRCPLFEEESPSAAPPAFALSSETLATGSRPRAALAFGGRVFTRTLDDRMFRQQQPRPLLPGEGGRGLGTITERERMEEWLGEVLWG